MDKPTKPLDEQSIEELRASLTADTLMLWNEISRVSGEVAGLLAYAQLLIETLQETFTRAESGSSGPRAQSQ